MTSTEDLGSNIALPELPNDVRDGSGFRTYEVFQRQRVRDATPLITPRKLRGAEYLGDPYSMVAILRENYPCYRDWGANCFWVSRYDDVTSVFMDDANYETRSKLWFYERVGFGRDLRGELPVLWCRSKSWDANARPLAESIVDDLVKAGRSTDLATEFAARFSLELLGRTIGVPSADFEDFVKRYWLMQRGHLWEPRSAQAGREAMDSLVAYFRPLLDARRGTEGEDLVTVMANLVVDGVPATAEDLVVTLLEDDHETLHGALANLWFLLLTHPDQYALLKDDRRWVRFAYQETLRHSAPVITAKRFAKHEVERFGRLLPEGALLMLSAAAANRDPRQFEDPDRFDVQRTDICQREPRGTYRADGLPAGVSFGTGKPSRFPAVPEDRPRSLWALSRDAAVTASMVLLDRLPDLRLADGAAPALKSLRLHEMHTCWSLPVSY
jgi:pulcherriminic acid synthase